MSSKVRRKVTVDMGKSDESDKRKPSVFERLGPGGGQRKYEYDSDSPREEKYHNQCLNWMKYGTCKYGSSCKYAHPPLKSGPSKRKESYKDNDSPDGLRLKFKGHKSKKKRADSSESPERSSRSKAKRDKDKMRSTVTIKKAGYRSDDESDESGRVRDDDMEDLDYAEELHLQQKRQQLEQALSLLPASEEEERENITIERRLGAEGHDSEMTLQKRGHSKRKKPLSARKKTDKKKRRTQRSSSPEEREKKKHGKHRKKSKKHLDTDSDDDSSSDQDMQKGKKGKMKHGKRGYESPGESPARGNKKSRSQTPSYQDQKRPKPLMAPSALIPSLIPSGVGQKDGTPRALMSVVPDRERGDKRDVSAERVRDKARRPQNPSLDHERERGQGRSRSQDEHEDRRPERLMDLPVQERGRHSDSRPTKGRRPVVNSSGSSESDSSDDSSSPEEVIHRDQRIRGDRRERGRDMPQNTEGREQRGREGRGRGARETEPRDQPPSPPGRVQGSRRMPELMSTRADSPDRRPQGRRRPLMPENPERGGRAVDPRRSPPPEFIDARSPRRPISPSESYHSDNARSPSRHQHRPREISPFEQNRNRFREREEEFERAARRSISPTEFRRRRDGSNPRDGFRGGEMQIHGDLPGRERFEPQPTTTYRDDRRERFPEDIPPFDSRARFEAERREFEQERFEPGRDRFEIERYDPERFRNRSDPADPWYETERGRGPPADPFELPPGEFPEDGWGRSRNRRGPRGRPQRENGRGRGERFPGRGRGRRSDERGGRSQMRMSRRGDWENQRGEVFPPGEHELWPERMEERRDFSREDRRREELVGPDRALRREGRSNERPEGRRMDRLVQEREDGRHPREEGRYPREESRPSREDSRPPRDEGRPSRDEGRPPREEGRPSRDEGRPPRDEGRPSRDEGRQPREEGRPSRDEGRQPREEGRPQREEGRPAREDGRQPREEGRPLRDESRPAREDSRQPREEGRSSRDESRPPREEGRSLREDARQAREEGRPPRDEGRPPRDDDEFDQRGRRDEDRLERREEGWEKRRNARRGRPMEEGREDIHEDPRKRPLDYDQRALSPCSKRFRDVSPISIESHSSENSADKGNDGPKTRKRGEKRDRHRREPSEDSGPGDIVDIRRIEKEQALLRQRERSLRGSQDREIHSPDRESSASRARSKGDTNKDAHKRKEKDVLDAPSKERQDKEQRPTRGRRESPDRQKEDNKPAIDRSEVSSRESRDRLEAARRDEKDRDREGSSRNGREVEESAKRDERRPESSRRGKARGETSNKDEKHSPVNRERGERERKETLSHDVREREREDVSVRDDRRARSRRSKGGKDRQVDIQTRLLGYAEGYKGADRARERRSEPETSERAGDNRKEISDERRGQTERRSKKATARSDDSESHAHLKESRDMQAKEKESSLHGDESVEVGNKVPDTPSSPAKEEEKPRTESQISEGVEREPAQAVDKDAEINESNEIQPIKSPSIKQDTKDPEQAATGTDDVIGEEDGGPEVFSDWSDDPSAEDILNQPEDKQAAVEQLRRDSDERPRSSLSRSSYGSRYSGERARHRQADRHRRPAGRPSSRDRRRDDRRRNEGSFHRNASTMENGRHLQESKTMNVDDALQFEYDSISSEEGDLLGAEDKDGKTSVFDALNIDWSSLMQDQRPKQPTGSALQRFQPANLLASIGVSRAYAGEALYERIKTECQRQLIKQHKENVKSADDDGSNIDKDVPVFELHSDIASFHTTISKKIKDRAHLLQNIGPYRRALCARKDLDIRKRLCKVEKSFDQSPVYPVQVMDNDLCKLGIQLFRQSQEKEKKDLSTLLPKTEVSCS